MVMACLCSALRMPTSGKALSLGEGEALYWTLALEMSEMKDNTRTSKDMNGQYLAT